jgi:hypothetical protein
VISGNAGAGILLSNATGVSGTSNQIVSNTITFNGADGVSVNSGALANLATQIASNTIANNAGNGVDLVLTSGTSIDANTIANNAMDGVKIDTGTANSIRATSLFADLGRFEIEFDNHANNDQPAPVLTSATSAGGSTTIIGTLQATPGTTYLIQFFSSPTAGAAGSGEGQTVLNAVVSSVTTDSTGRAAINVTLPVAVAAGQFVTATATSMATGDTSQISPSIRADTPPVAVDHAYVTNEDEPLVVSAPGVLANDTAALGNPLTATLMVQPTNGSVTLNPDGSFVYTPKAHFSGSDQFTYTASDGTLASSAATVTLSVNPNVAPTLDAIANPPAILEDSGPQTVSLTDITAGGGATQSLTVTAVSSNPALIPNPSITYTSPGATGTLTYTPVVNESGAATITVLVGDDGGTANGGSDTTTQTFAVTVTPVVATHLVVTSPLPDSVAVGAPFGLTVTAEDDAGHLATSFAGAVTVALLSDPRGASLDGTLTALASHGVATFSGLALDKTGSYILQLSGGGLTVASGAITATGEVTSAGHQIYSTAEKQAFLALSITYAQRAARLTALATVTPSPLNVPIDQLAAYYWYESQTYKAIADDPSDNDFTTVAPVQLATVPPLSPGGGVTQAEASAFNALFTEKAQALGLEQALSTALNRAQAAAQDPANAAFEQLQLAAVTMFSQQLGQVAPAEPGLLANVQAALQAGGVADVSVSASDLQALQAAGTLPAGLANALQQLASSDAQLQSIRLQDIQNTFATQNAAAAAGSLAVTLTDPTFAAQVQTAAQSLTATVLLSGSFRPASGSSVSHGQIITNDATPTFVGTAPPGTTVQLFAQSQVDSTPMLIGTGVTDPSDNWQITAAHLGDSTYAISARFTEGDSGFVQVTPLTQIVIETVAPRITNVAYSSKSGKVTITFDAPAGFNPASLTNSALYVARTKGPKSPPLKVSGIQQIGMQVTFTVAKGRAHPSRFYLDVVASRIQDLAGNALDGEFNGTFPTGNGHPGGDFSHLVPTVTHNAPNPRKVPHRPKR